MVLLLRTPCDVETMTMIPAPTSLFNHLHATLSRWRRLPLPPSPPDGLCTLAHPQLALPGRA